VVAPSATPKAILERLNREINIALKKTEVSDKITSPAGLQPADDPPTWAISLAAALVVTERPMLCLASSRNDRGYLSGLQTVAILNTTPPFDTHVEAHQNDEYA
jgi:hypothetical protein